MFSRIRAALGITFLLVLLTSITAFAKGGFSFITIGGPSLKEEVRVTDPALTEDFFAFANFYQDKTKEPAEPGIGYEITRYYVDGNREYAFDRLHYYPDTGFVFYDGIENGESEYDGEWYAAKPEIKIVFESALSAPAESAGPVEEKQPIPSVSQPPVDHATTPSQPVAPRFPSLPVLIILVVCALAVFLGLTFWRRKPAER
jgi:hypothetical protein